MADLLGMSDEDFLNSGEALMGGDDLPTKEESNDPEPEEGEGVSEEGHPELQVDDAPPSLEDDIYSAPSGSEEEEEVLPEGETAPEEGQSAELDVEGQEAQNTSETAPEEPSVAQDNQRVFEPFRANGKDVQVKSADEAITLMQLGANYTKKMQELSPNLKLLKSLEKNDLLDEGKLNYLIDLSKNDPKAIAKLVKEAKFELPEVGLGEEQEDDVEYTPTNHQVSDKAMELETVLTSLESTPTYDKVIDLVGNQWDAKSKQLLTQEPSLIRSLNEQMQAGIFDKINSEVERAKMFGGLSGLSDFEAYKTVGAHLMQQGQLSPQVQKPVAKTQVKPLDKAISKQRQAATTSRSTSKTTAKESLNPLAMSDEDFLKLNNIQL